MVALQKYVEAIDGRVVGAPTVAMSREITGGYVSDLLSDVMGNAGEGQAWITIMRHLNVVAVASLAGIGAIIFSNDILPDEAVIQKAEEESVPLVTTAKTSFECAGILYALLKQE